jgi:cold shock CspA family protein
MADTFNKKNLEQKKAKKKKEKLERKEERRANNEKGKKLEDMIAYIDEFGNITDVPPNKQNRIEINIEDIQLGAAPVIQEKTFSGILSLFFPEKGYGFITDSKSKESVFVHSNNFLEPIVENDKVSFEKEKTPKGFAAINVKKIK